MAVPQVLGGAGVVAPRVEHVGQAEVQCRAACPRQSAASASSCRMVARSAVGQLAAQQGRQLGVRRRRARVAAAAPRGSMLGRGEVPQLLEDGAQIAVPGGEVRLEPQGFAVAAPSPPSYLPCSCRTQPRPLWASAESGSSRRATS